MQRLLNTSRTYALALLLGLTLLSQIAGWSPPVGRVLFHAHAPAPAAVCPGESELEVCL